MEAGLTNLKELTGTFSSISEINEYLSRSPSLINRIMLENQDLLKDNMDKHFELEAMRRLKRENLELRTLVEKKMEDLLAEHQTKLDQFGLRIEEFYKETLFYINKQNLEKEKKYLKGLLDQMKTKSEKVETQNKEINKRIRNKELECDMIKMDLKNTRKELSVFKKEGDQKVHEIMKKLSVTYPEDYQFTKSLHTEPMRIQEERLNSELENSLLAYSQSTRRNARDRIIGSVRNTKSQKKKGKRKRRRKKKTEPVPIIDEEDPVFHRPSRRGYRRNNRDN